MSGIYGDYGSHFDPHLSPKGTPINSEHEAQQMIYVLALLAAMGKFLPQDQEEMEEIENLQSQFQQQSQQKPIPIQKMQQEINSLMDNIAESGFPWFKWSLSGDQTKPGSSFMQALHGFSEFIAGHWGNQNPALQQQLEDWVAKIGNFINQGPWTPEALSQITNSYFYFVNNLGKNSQGQQFPYIEPFPTNFFSSQP